MVSDGTALFRLLTGGWPVWTTFPERRVLFGVSGFFWLVLGMLRDVFPKIGDPGGLTASGSEGRPGDDAVVGSLAVGVLGRLDPVGPPFACSVRPSAIGIVHICSGASQVLKGCTRPLKLLHNLCSGSGHSRGNRKSVV